MFPATRWTVVMSATDPGKPEARQALEQLCKDYWYPLYAFVRRRGYAPQDAQDLAQDFFARLVERNVLASVQRERAKFRTFLVSVLKNFLNNTWDRQRRLKRGGHLDIVSWDLVKAEGHFVSEGASVDAELSFDRDWACALTERVMTQLRAENAMAEQSAVYAELHPFLTGEVEPGTYEAIGSRLGKDKNAVKVALHRLRRRFGELLRGEVRQTVASQDEVESELRHLFAALEG